MPRFGEFAWIEPDDIEVMEGHFRAAESAAAGDARLLRRIAKARRSLARVVEVRSRLKKCAPEAGFAGGREFYEFGSDWLDLYDKDNVKMQKDPLAASGSAACIDVRPGKYDLPFVVACCWSKSGRKPLKRSYDELKPGDGYSWYMLDVPDVPTNGYFFAMPSTSILTSAQPCSSSAMPIFSGWWRRISDMNLLIRISFSFFMRSSLRGCRVFPTLSVYIFFTARQ